MTDKMAKEKGVKLSDILDMIDEHRESSYPVIICPECEEETWLYTTASSPLLVPLGDLLVGGLDIEQDKLQIWVLQEYVKWGEQDE